MNGLRQWFHEGVPWIWMSAGAVSISLLLVLGVLAFVAAKGLVYFWPSDIQEVQYAQGHESHVRVIGQIYDAEEVPTIRLRDSRLQDAGEQTRVTRYLYKVGNRDVYEADFIWLVKPFIVSQSQPKDIVVIERREWGNFYGYVETIRENDQLIAAGESAIAELPTRLDRALDLSAQIHQIEKRDIGKINHTLERLRLRERRLELKQDSDPDTWASIDEARRNADTQYKNLQERLEILYTQINRDSITATVQTGQVVEIPLATVVRVYYPNAMNVLEKLMFYVEKIWEFVADEPREANTEGGIFPAIFGTVMMVIIMSIIVTPFGIVAAVYLREYARQGPLVRTIRIAVNNLAGVPSIVYGVFGLGFFVYFLGGNIDRLFYPEALPAPTFGSPGILWAALTLAILTLPVVIVSTEEGLARIPRSIREGSLATGATKAETLWRVVLPMSSPAMMTGLILAVARAAGEVAPLMLVGVVKLAPSMPLDTNFPFLHLDRKFMHLGFHIYDVGFQSPNVEAARPLVYATALLLVLVIIALNMTAIGIRNYLREKYRALEA